MLEVYDLKLFLIPLLSAIVGWSTNRIAIYNLFHPIFPILGIQGVIPKNIDILAEKTAREIDGKVVVVDDIVHDIANKVAVWLPIMRILSQEHIDEIVKIITNNIDIKKHIEDNLKNIDVHELEKIIHTAAKSELKRIEVVGAVIGFLVGLCNVSIFLIF